MISSTVSPRLSNVLCPAVDVLVGEVEILREGDTEINDDTSHGDYSGKKRKHSNATTDNHTTNINTTNISASPRATKERRINHYIRAQVDPSYVHLSHVILARNASMIRHTVATSIYTAQKVIKDYMKAMKKDGGEHNSFNM